MATESQNRAPDKNRVPVAKTESQNRAPDKNRVPKSSPGLATRGSKNLEGLTSTWCRPSTLSPVSKPSGPRGALPGPPDFWCNRHCNTSPVVLSRQGNVLGPQRPHPKHMFHQNKHDLRRGVWPCAKTKPQQNISKQPPKTQNVRVSSRYPPPETVENLNASFIEVCVNDGTWTLY